MKADAGTGLRLGAALLLYTLIVMGVYLIGAAQTFDEEALAFLYSFVRWLSWGGLLVTWLGLVPWVKRRGRRTLAAVLIAIGFTLLFAFVVVWGAWIYPTSEPLW